MNALPKPEPAVSLTSYLGLRSIRSAWKAYFPHTSSCVSLINESCKHPLVIPLSRWVQWNKRASCVGTAYDYLVGTVWGGQSLESPLERAVSVVSRFAHYAERIKQQKQTLDAYDRQYSKFPERLTLLKQFLTQELQSIQTNGTPEIHPDFLRALGALADLDVMSRSILVPSPDWIRSRRVIDLSGLLSILRIKYPNPFVNELRALYEVTTGDLPRTDRIVYNPAFGGAEGIPLGADGDLLLDDLLVDLKVSVKRFRGTQLWQTLGYAALDRLKGERRIKHVGLYNPRYRAFWSTPVEDLTRKMGGVTFDHFCGWFRQNASPSNVEQALLHDEERLLRPIRKLFSEGKLPDC